MTNTPSSDFSDMLRDIVMPVAPNGTNQIHLADGTSTAANEVAITTALMSHAHKHKKDLHSLVVLGFENGSHG